MALTPAGNVIYLSNKTLLAEVKACREQGKMSNQLANMLIMLCAKYSRKGNWVGYPFNQDMQGYAMLMLTRTWSSFDPAKSDNPFAFYTQCIKNSFIQYIKNEKKQFNIRDLVRIDQGLNPSFGYSDGKIQPLCDDDSDFDFNHETFQQQQAQIILNEQPIERDDLGLEICPDIVDEIDVNSVIIEDDES